MKNNPTVDASCKTTDEDETPPPESQTITAPNCLSATILLVGLEHQHEKQQLQQH